MNRNRTLVVIVVLMAASLLGAVVLLTAGNDEDQSIAAPAPALTSPPVAVTTAESSIPEQPIVTVEPVTTAPRPRYTVTTAPASRFTGWNQTAMGGLGGGNQHTFTCPSGGQASTVWGTDIYTHDSSVCTAAVHAGLIDFEDGGVVVIEMRPGEASYVGTTANGVTTMSYGRWGLSFVFVGPTPSAAESVATTVGSSEPSASTLPDLSLPRYPPSALPGEYGWTGALGSRGGMHSVVVEDPSSNQFRQSQLVFAVRNDCFGESGDPVAVEVAGLDSLHVEPFERWSMTFLPPRGSETTGAYALPIGDRTLCVYLTWDPTTTEEELAAGREIVESIRGQPHGEDGIRINFTLPAGWDTG
jgi:hypothetical protein